MRKIFLSSILLLNVYGYDIINYSGDTVEVKASKTGWNRLIFDSEINADPIYSLEKNLEVKKTGNSLFFKCTPMQKIEIVDGVESVLDIKYDKCSKNELFISTKSATYSFMIIPKKINTKTYKIQDIRAAEDDVLKFEVDPVREVFASIVKELFNTSRINKYREIKTQESPFLFDDFNITQKSKFVGKIYTVYYYDLKAIKSVEDVKEKLFIDLPRISNIRALSLKEKSLNANDTTELIVIVGN